MRRQQQQKVALTRKWAISIRFTLWFLGICVILSFLGTVLNTVKQVGPQVVYPSWLQISWNTVNILLSPVAGLGVYILLAPRLFQKSNTLKGWISWAIDYAIPLFFFYIGYTYGCLSPILFIAFVILFLFVWIKIPDEVLQSNRP